MAVPALAAALAGSGCWERARPDLEVRLDADPLVHEAPSPPLEAADRRVRFVYASVLSPERSAVTYARLGSYLASRLGRPVDIVRRRTYAELNELLRSGEADGGLVCTGAFALGQQGFGLEALVVPVIRGSTTYRSYVVARRDAGIGSFDDLRGRTFAFSDPLSNTGYRYVAAKLLEMGLDPETYFGRFFFTYSHDNTIQAVRDGIADGGSIDSLVWDELVRRDPSLQRELVILERSKPFPINPVVAAPGADAELRARLKSVFLEMHQDPEGRQVLQELGTDRFVEPTPELLEGYRTIAESWARLGG